MIEQRRRSARIASKSSNLDFDPLEYYTAPAATTTSDLEDAAGTGSDDSSALSDLDVGEGSDESEFDSESDGRASKRQKISAGGKHGSRVVKKTSSTVAKRQHLNLHHNGCHNGKSETKGYSRLNSGARQPNLRNPALWGTKPPMPPIQSPPLNLPQPLLLSSPTALATRDALLTWFDSVSSSRRMPWRKPWIDTTSLLSSSSSSSSTTCPDQLRETISQRAYEVLLSETMLQQTRVSTVIAYYNKWLAALPTIQSLAAAKPEEVLSLWKGLGYYSRATRLHSLAQMVCPPSRKGGYDGLLPATVDKLMKLPGVGRYTAGAVACIVYGRAEPMVDGNVIRVLARQLGIRGDVKSKEVLEVVWEAARRLVEVVAWDGTDGAEEKREGKEPPVSDRPGRWGQGLMELGATVCLGGPAKPKCGVCPIKETCRAYEEGVGIATKKGLMTGAKKENVTGRVVDIEDCCTLCPPPEEEESDKKASIAGPKKRKKGDVSGFFDKFKASSTRRKPEPTDDSDTMELSAAAMEVITTHCSIYPYAQPKTKKLREEECLVIAIRRPSDMRYLIHQRPAKGLLAGMWELPSHTLPADSSWTDESMTSQQRMDKVFMVLWKVLQEVGIGTFGSRYWYTTGEEEAPGTPGASGLGTVPWTFSHFKLSMHVWAFDIIEGELVPGYMAATGKRWATVEEIDRENMGTGMKKCWQLVKERADLVEPYKFK
ncbi:DNA glycosylase [Sordaria brevicollis]|uniref:Adenine DNA glycosylase n=1 Tax=Sordaria brevicollis TaxID=83679 RepID=A0AAE0PK29_SORBR|nr:DNA glycosylase [Sordaria brevicollis]